MRSTAVRSFLLLAGLAVLPFASLPLNAQTQGGTERPLKASTSTADAERTKLSKDALGKRGFSFDGRKHPVCTINGSEGPCGVEAFVFGEKNDDSARYTCRKLNKSNYVGHCVNGKLDGLSLVVADGEDKLSREAYISYFDQGRIAYPALTSWLTGNANFGVRQKDSSFGCVYFGKWDMSADRCAQFIEIYGRDLFTEANAEKLKDGIFDLDYYRSKFIEFVQQKQK
jgi:hypothetical protein